MLGKSIMGRTKLDFNWEKLDSYLEFKASKKSCAILLDVSVDTIERRIKEEYGQTFSEYAETKIAPIKFKLVSKAINKALDGDNTLLIFCLKNIAGWSDKPEREQDLEREVIQLRYRLDSMNAESNINH